MGEPDDALVAEAAAMLADLRPRRGGDPGLRRALAGLRRPRPWSALALAMIALAVAAWLAIPGGDHRAMWRQPALAIAAPAIAGDRCIVPDGRGLAAWRLADGGLAWRRVLPGALAVALAGGQPMAVGGRPGAWWLTAIDPADGRTLWTLALPGRDRPAVAAAMPAAGLAVAVAGGQVIGIGAADGAVRWRSPVVAEGGAVVAFAADGRRIWRQATGGGRPLLAPAADGAVIADAGGIAACAVAADGLRERWRRPLDRPARILVDGDRIAVRGAGLAALRLADGGDLWRAGDPGCGELVAAGGRLYAIDNRGRLLIRSWRDGREEWSWRGVAACTGIALAGSLGIVRDGAGGLVALRLDPPPAAPGVLAAIGR